MCTSPQRSLMTPEKSLINWNRDQRKQLQQRQQQQQQLEYHYSQVLANWLGRWGLLRAW